MKGTRLSPARAPPPSSPLLVTCTLKWSVDVCKTVHTYLCTGIHTFHADINDGSLLALKEHDIEQLIPLTL